MGNKFENVHKNVTVKHTHKLTQFIYNCNIFLVCVVRMHCGPTRGTSHAAITIISSSVNSYKTDRPCFQQ